MPRPAVHSVDSLLDAARTVVLEDGVGAVTVAGIAKFSGAPTGSIYYRFGSVQELLASMWLRAVQRSQADFAAATRSADALEGAVAAALSVYDFADRHPADARLLISVRREDLVRQPLSADLNRQLTELNRPMEAVIADLARRHYGRAAPGNVDAVALAVIDLPMGALRRPLAAGRKLTPRRREALEAAVRAALLA